MATPASTSTRDMTGKLDLSGRQYAHVPYDEKERLFQEVKKDGRFDDYLYGLPKTFLEDFRTRVESLTAAQIEAASARHLDTYRQAIAIVGDWQKVKDQVTPFGTVTVYTPEGEIKKGVA